VQMHAERTLLYTKSCRMTLVAKHRGLRRMRKASICEKFSRLVYFLRRHGAVSQPDWAIASDFNHDHCGMVSNPNSEIKEL
jgi:beta-lactamase superfamily II metal-dependent hydrolase